MSPAHATRMACATDWLCRLAPRERMLEHAVEVWLAAPGALVEGAWRLRHCLSSAERRRMDRFRFERDRDLYLASHVFLRQVLCLYGPADPRAWRFAAGARGRPEIVRPPQPPATGLRFSLSHAHGLVAVAVARGWDVGVDVERHRDDLDVDALAAWALAAPERAWFAALAPAGRAAAFVTLWTVKEALLKACGAGIGRDLAHVALLDGVHAPRAVLADAPELAGDGRWSVAYADADGAHAVAVAARGPLCAGPGAGAAGRRLAVFDLRRPSPLAGDALHRTVVLPVHPAAARAFPSPPPAPEDSHDTRHP